MIAERTLSYVGKAIANALNRMASESRFDVTLRLYSGWYKGFEASVRRKAIVTASAGAPSLSTRPNVVIRPTVEFGDRLISALPTRLHRRIDIHLGDTYRRSMTDKTRFEEKMVDTAIAADLVDLAHSEPERWLLLLGEDDDLIPPLLVANGIRKQNHGRISILRKRSETPFLQFADLRICP